MKNRIWIISTFIILTLVSFGYAQDIALKNGPMVEYYESGAIMNEHNFLNGEFDGSQKSYYESGQIESEGHYRSGIKEGLFREYFENGKIKREAEYKNDNIDGAYKIFDEQGNLLDERHYKENHFLDQQGNNYTGDYKYNYKNGQLMGELHYNDGLAEGTSKIFNSNGNIESERELQNGKFNGTSREFDEKGLLISESAFVNDHLNGPVKSYYASGELETIFNFVDDKREGESQHFYENGKIADTAFFKNDVQDGISKGYYENGQLKYELNYINDVPQLPAKEFYEDGREKKQYIVPRENNFILFGFLIYAVFLFSIVFHEGAHAWMAHRLGDSTAHDGGQVTLNPIPHIRREIWGTVIVPILSYLKGGGMMGWASAPYDPLWAIEYPKKAALMSLAGPMSNFLLFISSVVIIKLGLFFKIFIEPDSLDYTVIVASTVPGFWAGIAALVSVIFCMNLTMFLFNLIPLPPLDGSGLVGFFLPASLHEKYLKFSYHPTMSIMGLLMAWYIFDQFSGTVFLVAINLVFPGLDYH